MQTYMQTGLRKDIKFIKVVDNMENSVIAVGDKIDLVPIQSGVKEDTGRLRKNYVSSLLEEPDGDELKIAMPIDAGKIIPLPVGGRYVMCFYTQKGLYQCKCEVIKRIKDDRMFSLIVRMYTALEKNQRREYFRLDCVIDMRYRTVSPAEIVLRKRLAAGRFSSLEDEYECQQKLKAIEEVFEEKGIVTDISGGGLRFHTDKQLDKENEIIVKLQLPMENDTLTLMASAEVISSNKSAKRANSFDNRIRFVKISEDEREQVIKFIFLQERKNLRREKGM